MLEKDFMYDTGENDNTSTIRHGRVVLQMPDNLENILDGYRENMEKIFENHTFRIILYGSYARGDFHQDSDVDIMILADVKPEEISRYADKIYDITYDLEMKYGMEINPCIQSIQIYNQWKKVYLFFMNIEKDGVLV